MRLMQRDHHTAIGAMGIRATLGFEKIRKICGSVRGPAYRRGSAKVHPIIELGAELANNSQPYRRTFPLALCAVGAHRQTR